MDPLSISAGVVGLLTAAAQVTSTLIRFTKDVRDAPTQAQMVLNEVDEITIILHQVQSFLNGTKAINRNGASSILIEQVIVVFAGCVMTFSELETVLNSLKTDGPLDTIDRIKWVRKDSTIAGLVQRLQNHKISMNLMLTILASATTRAEANESVDRLYVLVERVLESHDNMANRIRGMDSEQKAPVDSTAASLRFDINHQVRQRPEGQQIREEVDHRPGRFAFEEDLDSSAVYKKALFNRSESSLVSSAARSTASSVLSGLSMGDVSMLAVYALPIYPTDINNSQYYHFGDVPEEPLRFDMETTTAPRNDTNHLRSVPKGLKRSGNERGGTSPVGDPRNHVFGFSLAQTMEYAKVQTSWHNKTGTRHIYEIPIVLAKCGSYLKLNAVNTEGLFWISGSIKRMKMIQKAFDTGPSYGLNFDWSGYTVHDAASVLLRYLSRLPGPLIGIENHDALLSVCHLHPILASYEDGSNHAFEPRLCNVSCKATVTALADFFKTLPFYNYCFLLYIMDMFAEFQNHRFTNSLSEDRLVNIIHPCLLRGCPPATHDCSNIGHFMLQHWKAFERCLLPDAIGQAQDTLSAFKEADR